VRLPATYLRGMCTSCFNALLNICFAVASRGTQKELARRDATRAHNSFRWFTPDEAVVAEALARIIVPSDEETPGMDEVGVLDAPAIVALDHLVATSSYRQNVYSRGLLSFDTWALKEGGCKFAEMSSECQIALVRAAQQMYEEWTGSVPAIRKAWRRLRAITRARDGSFFAAQLYPQIRNDCLRVFYTSRVAWTWLEYDGPPMDKGYPSVVAPREQ
jgi:hypothetical protein